MVLEAHVHQLIALSWLLECCCWLERKLQGVNAQPEACLNRFWAGGQQHTAASIGVCISAS
jgi:hypothetical protein